MIGTAPAEFDWRIEEGVTPIKNQLSCGASWAFAAVAAIESAHYANWSQLIPFSEQSFIDCATDASCTTGTPSTVYDYALELEPTGDSRLMIRS
jgi:KDEL-tailed cysteine endopeptidase